MAASLLWAAAYRQRRYIFMEKEYHKDYIELRKSAKDTKVKLYDNILKIEMSVVFVLPYSIGLIFNFMFFYDFQQMILNVSFYSMSLIYDALFIFTLFQYQKSIAINYDRRIVVITYNRYLTKLLQKIKLKSTNNYPRIIDFDAIVYYDSKHSWIWSFGWRFCAYTRDSQVTLFYSTNGEFISNLLRLLKKYNMQIKATAK